MAFFSSASSFSVCSFAVIFRIIAEGLPGLVNEQHTIPVMSPDGSKTGNMSRNYHFAVSAKSKYKELAWKHLEWLNNGPEYRMQDFQTNTFGFVQIGRASCRERV